MITKLKYPRASIYCADKKGKEKQKIVKTLRSEIEQILAARVSALSAAIQAHVATFNAPPFDIYALVEQIPLESALGMHVGGETIRAFTYQSHCIVRIHGLAQSSPVAASFHPRYRADPVEIQQ